MSKSKNSRNFFRTCAEHRFRGFAPTRQRHLRADRQTFAVLHQRMTHMTKLGVAALRLAIEGAPTGRVLKDGPLGSRGASPVAGFHCVRFADRSARNGTSGFLPLVLRDGSYGSSSA